jgi:hypothetical protein
MFRPKRDELTGGCRKLYNEEVRDWYSSPCVIRIIKTRISWTGHLARMGEESASYSLLVGKPEGTTPLRRPRRKWADNIKMDLVQIRWRGVAWRGLDWSGSG